MNLLCLGESGFWRWCSLLVFGQKPPKSNESGFCFFGLLVLVGTLFVVKG